MSRWFRVFSSSDTNVADVTNSGLVEFQQSGEVAILCRYLDEMLAVRLTYLQPKEGFHWNDVAQNNYVDQFVLRKLKMLSILPSDGCSDQEFVRRVHLDVVELDWKSTVWIPRHGCSG